MKKVKVAVIVLLVVLVCGVLGWRSYELTLGERLTRLERTQTLILEKLSELEDSVITENDVVRICEFDYENTDPQDCRWDRGYYFSQIFKVPPDQPCEE